MTQPLITVLMATYNVEKYVVEAVESVLAQTFKDFEFIVVDDGSQDRTLEFLGHFSDVRMRVISTENGGLTAALNAGLQVARGKYIARMDSDDVCHPSRLESQLRDIASDDSLAMAGSWYQII